MRYRVWRFFRGKSRSFLVRNIRLLSRAGNGGERKLRFLAPKGPKYLDRLFQKSATECPLETPSDMVEAVVCWGAENLDEAPAAPASFSVKSLFLLRQSGLTLQIGLVGVTTPCGEPVARDSKCRTPGRRLLLAPHRAFPQGQPYTLRLSLRTTNQAVARRRGVAIRFHDSHLPSISCSKRWRSHAVAFVDCPHADKGL